MRARKPRLARRIRPWAAAAALAALLAHARGAGDTGAALDVPVHNWSLPLWTKDGCLSMTLRGSEATAINDDQIAIVDMNITVFSGDASRNVDTVVMSPQAIFFERERRATGPGWVRLIDFRDHVEVTGEDWTYEQAAKKISIRRNVHVVYEASLNLNAP